uniref:Patatin n=1 Tax=Setaria viridis TaxID=4556 RepID=A0A4U6VGX8_SETVI|nr:hypothetical protein SEVIR_3G354900v2 [Setaria viridis]
MAKAHNLLKAPEDDCGRFLVLSIGTGLSSDEGMYTAKIWSKWGILGWLRNRGMAPIIDIFMAASSDLVDIHVAVKFKLFRSERNYLRIQDNTLGCTAAAMDRENMRNLVKIGERMLKQKVSRVNVDTGKYEAVQEENRTNAEPLNDLAKELSKERTVRRLKVGPASGGMAQ